MELDLRQLAQIARRWWWLLLLAPLIAGGAAYYATSQQTPLYSATVTMRVNPPAGRAADFSSLQLTQNLTETYRQILVTSPVLQLVIDELALPYDVGTLKSKSTASAVANTQLLRLSISDPDPDQAALIANTTAAKFIAYLNQQMSEQFQGTQDMLNGELQTLDAHLKDVRAQISDLENRGVSLTATEEAQLSSLRLEESQLVQQQTTLQLQAQTLGVGLATSQAQVTVSEPAAAPASPYAPRILFNTMLGIFLGGLLAVGGVALLEYLDNTVRSDTNLGELTGSVLLTNVDNVPDLASGRSQLYVLSHPHSAASEAIRLLRANLEFAAVAKPLKSIAVTSAGPGEGKSTITANLAVVLAQAGFSTVVVDADLRKPTQHTVFNVSNQQGLSTLLTHPQRDWQSVALNLVMPNLKVVTSGPIPPNPSDLLSIDRFTELLKVLEDEADIVLVDTPPVLAVSDPLLVGTKVDGVVLLGRSEHTKRESLARAAESLRNAGAHLVGVVINRQSSRTTGYYYYYNDKSQAKAQKMPDVPETKQTLLSERS